MVRRGKCRHGHIGPCEGEGNDAFAFQVKQGNLKKLIEMERIASKVFLIVCREYGEPMPAFQTPGFRDYVLTTLW